MADRNLNIIINAVDNASGKLKGLDNALERNKATIQKLSLAATAAFGAIAVGVNKTVQEAAAAEGSWNKFNTVFGEGADDMLAFVNNIRNEMPSATHEIARMSADLQDLLVPMGLARDEAQGLTMGFVDVANKVAAFNDVDPTQVLEAFKSGLSGSSEPLRAFGINALETSLELEALSSGLIAADMAFKDLDPITRSQVRAQALLSLSVKQSSDAINGFEVNNDSLIRRQQALQATISELSVTLGEIFLPIIDDAVKAIQPVITKVAEWVEQNPELTRNIVIAAAAIAGLVAVLGTLTLLFMAINPISLIVVGAIAGISAIFFALNNTLDMFGLTWGNVWEGIKQTTVRIVGAVITLVQEMINTVIKGINGIIRAINKVSNAAADVLGKDNKLEISEIKEVDFGGADMLRTGKMGGDTVNITIMGDVSGEELIRNVQNQVMRDLSNNVRLSPQ